MNLAAVFCSGLCFDASNFCYMKELTATEYSSNQESTTKITHAMMKLLALLAIIAVSGLHSVHAIGTCPCVAGWQCEANTCEECLAGTR